jgi:hypothetical protein
MDDTYDSFAQKAKETDSDSKSFWAKHPIYPAKDSQSEILPYNQRDHAWNEE